MNFSIIIPTCGRRTLARTLQSIQLAGLLLGDEVIVVGDGPQPIASEICKHFQPFMDVKYLEHGPTHCFGNAQRDFGMRTAIKDMLAFMDDDDEYVAGCLDVMRQFAVENPGKVLIFQMYHRSVGVIWKEKVLREGEVGTQTVVLPNVQERLSQWTCEQIPERDYMGDYYFFRRTVDNWPGKDAGIVWVKFPVAVHHMSWVQSESAGEWEPVKQ
jgi:glycosyltransferase involved in cell wall biosynthesis